MPALPIHTILADVARVLRDGRHAVLSAPPGAGKTTIVPHALLQEPWLHGQRIIMLEPRRLAARAAAHRMAAMLGESIGETVGYRIRLETKVGLQTRIEVVTEGILTRLLQRDPSLSGYGLVIFDEFHERTLQADLGLALTLETQRVFRPDLRLLVMSATLDGLAVARVLEGSPVLSCEGRQFPVETRYLERPLSIPVDQAVAQSIQRVLSQESGSVLVFLPGMAEIRRVERHLQDARVPSTVVIAPLHGELPASAQDRAMAPASPGQRKVVLSTSIAETSVTIEGIRVVIDAGLMRVPRFDPRTGLTRLDTITITQDSADQRRGRAGRVEPGVCYRLWTAADHRSLLRRRPPEILDADLAPLVLELAAWGETDPWKLSWLDPPPTGAVMQGKELLTRLGALHSQDRITAHGRRMAEWPLHPRLAHMVLKAIPLGWGRLACDVAALLGERDVLRGAPGVRSADLRIRLEALRGHLPQTPGVTVDRGAVDHAARVAAHLSAQLSREASHGPRAVHASDHLDRLGVLLAYAYPDRVAQRQPEEPRHYLMANGRGAGFAQHEPLCSEAYLVLVDVEGGGHWARIHLAAPVEVADLNAHCSDLIRPVAFVDWDDRAGVVRARTQRQLGALVLTDQPLLNPDPAAVSAALIEGIRRAGLGVLRWTPELMQWRARVAFLRRLQGKQSAWPEMSDQALCGRLAEWLGPFLNGFSRLDQAQRLDLAPALQALLTWQQRQQLERLAPTHLIVPTGSRMRLDYEGQVVPVLSVKIQEMFGCDETPTIVNGTVSVMVHLLSPAGRPMQVTQDLKSFWRSGYPDVRKELRGRYPKHHWPEDPLRAQPTRR